MRLSGEEAASIERVRTALADQLTAPLAVRRIWLIWEDEVRNLTEVATPAAA